MLKRLLPAAAILVLLSSPALASSCPKLMAQVDAALAASPMLTAEQMAEVTRLRKEGEAHHMAGKHDESEADLHKALRILGKE